MAAWATFKTILDDPVSKRRWWLIPLQDVISFLIWILGLFGKKVEWRGRCYNLIKDGQLCFRDGAARAHEEQRFSLPLSNKRDAEGAKNSEYSQAEGRNELFHRLRDHG